MGVKQKLGELVNVINTLDGDNSQLDEIVWDLLSEIDYNNLDYIQYYSSKINLDYNDFINVWYNFIKKNILEVPDEKIMDMQFEPVKSSLKISLFENELSQELEKLFNMHIECIEDDLLLFYIRNENKILLMYKSYIPLLDTEEVRLPFWEYKLEHPGIKQKFEEVFENEDNICIMGYSV
jgi:hypothetical protein